jgi:hypothetical protein
MISEARHSAETEECGRAARRPVMCWTVHATAVRLLVAL